jgi:hypothetical protein
MSSTPREPEPKMGIGYRIPSLSAIAGSLVLTAYSALTSWNQTHDPAGVIAAVGASLMLMLAVHFCVHHRRWSVRVLAVVAGILGIGAAVISGMLIKQRVATNQVAQVQSVKDANVPRKQAELALASAEAELTSAAADAKAECRKPRNATACRSATKREVDARNRVAGAREDVARAGAHATEAHADPVVASMLPVLLPWWVEASAPVLASLCAATWQAPAPDRRANGTSAPRVPTAPDGTGPPAPAPRARKRKAKGANGTTGTKRGTNSRAYILERLERIGRHDLVRAVRAREMSAKAAADAGFRSLKLIA